MNIFHMVDFTVINVIRNIIFEYSYFCLIKLFFNLTIIFDTIIPNIKFWYLYNILNYFSYVLSNFNILFFFLLGIFLFSFCIYIYLFIFDISWNNLRDYYLIQNIIIFLVFFIIILIFYMFPGSDIGFYYKFYTMHLFSFNIDFAFSLDRLNIFFLLLTSFLFIICGLICWEYSNENFLIFSLLSNWLHLSLILTFSSINLLSFFFFFEMSIWPVFMFLLLYGSRQRKTHAAYYFFMYTSLGSIFILIAFLMIYISTGTLNWYIVCYSDISFVQQIIIWLFLFIGFATKVPIPPFHIWLPEAHVEAPTFGSVLLAGILLKLGTYGMLRFTMIPLKAANEFFITGLCWFCAISIFYISYLSIIQTDLKKLIAYSSISHMLVVVLGIFLLENTAVCGCVYLMISHGFISPALFSLIGFLYERSGTREYFYYERVATSAPILTVISFLIFISNASLPLFAGFTGEFLVFIPILAKSYLLFFILCVSAFAMTIYNMWIFNRIFFGNNSRFLSKLAVNSIDSSSGENVVIRDVSITEFFILFLLIYFATVLGVFPSMILAPLKVFITNNLLFII